MTSKQLTFRFTEDKLTSSQEDSLVNPTQPQESDLEKKMTDTSGRSCLMQFGAFNPDGSWAKTFADLLIGRTAWSSKRCRLIWKLKGTKYKRLYFLLLASARPTEETESGLLPTPKTFDGTAENVNTGKTLIRTENGFANVDKNGVKWGPSLNDLARNQMLPTPTAMEDRSHPETWDKRAERRAKKGGKLQMGLTTMARKGLLPTPTTSCANGGTNAPRKDGKSRESQLNHWAAINREKIIEEKIGLKSMLPTPQAADGGNLGGNQNQDSLTKRARLETGKTSQLNPRFVADMMSFPLNWTELPFQNGETHQSKDTETQ